MTDLKFPTWEPKKLPFGIVSEDMVKIRIADVFLDIFILPL